MTVGLTLFGAPTIAFGGKSVALGFERRTQLLVYLALKRSWVTRAELAALLWPDQNSKLASTNLRKALHRLQGLPGAGRIEVQPGAMRFEARTDVHDFETALREQRIADALALHHGDLLAGFDDDSNEAWSRWMHFERDRLRSAWRAAAAQHLGGEVAATEAVDLAARLLDADPLDESALRLYVEWLVRAGQVARARQAYNAFVARLRDELGLAPGAELRSLQKLFDAAAVAVRVPEAKAATVDEGFVGRVVELRRIAALMTQDDCRLLCVIGPGGIGKTSLARRAMDQLALRLSPTARSSFRSTISRRPRNSAAASRMNSTSRSRALPSRWIRSRPRSRNATCCWCSTTSSSWSTAHGGSKRCWRLVRG